MMDRWHEARLSRRRLLAVGVTATAGAVLLRDESALAARQAARVTSDPVSDWLVGQTASTTATSLDASRLPRGNPLHITLSSTAPARRPDRRRQTDFKVGETFVVEPTRRIEGGESSVVALRLVPAIIGVASDVVR